MRVPGSGSSAAEARGPGRFWIGATGRAPAGRPEENRPSQLLHPHARARVRLAQPTRQARSRPVTRILRTAELIGGARSGGCAVARQLVWSANGTCALWLFCGRFSSYRWISRAPGSQSLCDPVSPRSCSARLIDDGGEKRRFNFILGGQQPGRKVEKPSLNMFIHAGACGRNRKWSAPSTTGGKWRGLVFCLKVCKCIQGRRALPARRSSTGAGPDMTETHPIEHHGQRVESGPIGLSAGRDARRYIVTPYSAAE